MISNIDKPSINGMALSLRAQVGVTVAVAGITLLGFALINLLLGGDTTSAVARGLMAMPAVLILDEPSLGLAPQVVHTVYRTVDELVSAGLTVLLVDQFAARALAIADCGYLLAPGRVVTQGSADALRNDPTIQNTYFGSP